MKYSKYIDKHVTNQKGKTFVITGATSGIGYALAFQLAYKEANLILACRNLDKANKVKEEILKQYPNTKIEIIHYDQADFSSIGEFAKEIENRKIDALILNAGIFHNKNNMVTTDGYPLTVGTNYLGAYYLSKLLKNAYTSNIKRVVITTSVVRAIGKTKHPKKYLLDVKNKPNRTYNVSKYMNYCLAGNLKSEFPNLEVVLTHPGIARTNIIKEEHSSLSKFIKVGGDIFLKIFANSAEKSAICTLIASTMRIEKPLEYVIPRVPFHFVGLPKVKQLKVNKIKNEQLRLASEEVLR